MVDPRPVVEAFQLGSGGDGQQVAVAGIVLRQQEQVEGARIQPRVPVLHASGSHVGLDADDGLDARLRGGIEEVDRAEHGAMVGEGQGRHPLVLGPPDQSRDAAQPIEQRVFGMNVEMDK
jgi:hypothetical protein